MMEFLMAVSVILLVMFAIIGFSVMYIVAVKDLEENQE